MRKIAFFATPVGNVCRLMIYTNDDGTFLFLYSKSQDGPCDADAWYPTVDAAEEAAISQFGIQKNDWQLIEDPATGAPHDWIAH